jgi:hypothetical protein
MRVHRTIIAVVVLIACAWHPAAGSAKTSTYVGEYKGTLTFKADQEGQSGGPIFLRVNGSVTFDAKFVTTVPESGGLPTTTGTFSGQGGYDFSGTNGPNVDTKHCGFSAPARADFSRGFSAAPGSSGADLNALVDQMLVSTGDCTGRPSAYLGLNACGSSGCTGVCEEDYAAGKAGDYAKFQLATSPVEGTYPKTGSKTTNYDVTLDPSGACYTGTQSITLSIQAAFTLGGSGATVPPRKPTTTPGLTKEQRDAKRAALETLQDAWGKALTACSGTAAFATLIAAGPAGEAVALVLGPAEAYQCKAWVEVVNDSANTFKDPPLPSDDVIARVAKAKPPKLPACGTADPSAVALCDQTRTAVLATIGATRRTATVAHAIELTVSRESYAQAHHHRSAASKQNKALHKLNAQLSTARKAESAAGRALASVITGAGLTVTRDAAQATSQINTLVGRLAKQGLSRAKVKTIDSALLSPQAGDWLTALAAS